MNDVTERYNQIESILQLAEMDMLAAEVHGIIVGAMMNHFKTSQAPELLTLVVPDHQQQAKYNHLQETLYEFYRDCSDTLLSSSDEFELLLPDDEESLAMRTEALSAWCKGYLLGLLYNNAFSIDQLSDNSAEILRDFMQISEAMAGHDSEREEDWALAELEEYVKVGVQLVFEYIYSERASEQQETVH